MHLAQKSLAGLQRPGNLVVDNLMVWKDGGRLKASFNTLLDPAKLSQQAFIYASGPLSGDTNYGFHSYGSGGLSIDLKSGAGSVSYDSVSNPEAVVRPALAVRRFNRALTKAEHEAEAALCRQNATESPQHIVTAKDAFSPCLSSRQAGRGPARIPATASYG